MSEFPPATPPSRSHREGQRHRMGTRLTATLLLLLGFGFTASALFGNPPEATPVAPPQPVADTTIALPNDDPGIWEVAEVSAAVRDWVWETPVPAQPSPGYDSEEPWLPR